MTSDTIIILAAHNEADRIAATLAALERAFEGARVFVSDDGSTDGTATIARDAGATVVSSETGARAHSPKDWVRNGGVGKGGAMTLAAHRLLEHLDAEPGGADPIVVLCDGDLGDSAARLSPLAHAVAGLEADLAVAAFARRVGGGFGLALGYARRAINRRCGLRTGAPISGQRAMRASTLRALLPFAHGFGMEVGMTIDAVRAGLRVVEVEIDLAHRATGRTLGGFLHRGRQLLDIRRAERARR